jgi:glycosyltransferase involved in cell wall biosynthesis
MTAHISVVIPTFNRERNLELCLTALCGQTRQDFSVVVSDDGSTDNTRQLVDRFRLNGDLRIGYNYQPHDGYRVSKARNAGVKVAEVAFQPTHILFVDSDVMLNPCAVAHYYELVDTLPKQMVICGRYDWLPPMELTPERVLKDWDSIYQAWADYVKSVVYGDHTLVDPAIPRVDGVPFVGGNLGRDPREPHDWDACTAPREAKTITLSGNLLVPLDVFHATGGFDEEIKAQGQDCAWSYELWSQGFPAVLCGHVYGLHVYHDRDKALTDTVQWTIQYIHNKYKDVPPPPEVGIKVVSIEEREEREEGDGE